jgi:hypothetical protein
VLSFLLLTGLSLEALSPAQAAEDPVPGHLGDSATQVVEDVTGTVDETLDEPLSVPATRAEAEESLGEVEELFDPMTRRESRSMITTGEGKRATMALRDLSLRLGSLAPAARGSAYAQFRRPWGNGQYSMKCQDNICVHWGSSKTYTGRDVTDDGFASQVLATMVNVSRTYRAAGYRTPRADGTYGGDGHTDIYLADVGAEGKYGYCTVDVDGTGHYIFGPSNSRASDLPAFCVLDNDFSKSQFPTPRTSLEDLQVTAAHEYFHAVQFGYDYLEDRWFMEATSTWAEDEVYPDINDNLQYLRGSQLRHPGTSLDNNKAIRGMLHYGDWIYFRYLTERLPAQRGRLPSLILQMWQRADSVSGRDQYSIQAVASTLSAHHLSFPTVFAQYAAANRHPTTAYAEGRANRYPSARPRRTVRLKPSDRHAAGAVKVNHLSSATVRFVPRHLNGKRKLTLRVNMAHKKSGSVAVALVYYRNGRIATRLVKLNHSGNGHRRVPFNTRTVRAVELTLVNANRRYRRCSGHVDGFSCGGVPVMDRVNESYSATVK